MNKTPGTVIGEKVKILWLADTNAILLRVGDGRFMKVAPVPHQSIEDADECVARLRDLANSIEEGAATLRKSVVQLGIVR